MTPQEFVTAVVAAFVPLADTERATAMKAYLLNQFEFLGLPAPVRRQAVRALGKVVWTRETLLRTSAQLWQKPEREYRYTAVDLLRQLSRLLQVQDLPTLRDLLQRESWWETVDGLSAVISEVLHRACQAEAHAADVMDEWVCHPDFWVRRSAMLHQLGWRLDTHEQRLFGYALQLAHEKEFFIRKAIGWALRDYARWQPQAVTDFVVQHRTQLSPLTVREATKHLDLS
jgi:3-methyladenine DNA glycosylase AlkD